jgi:hypothetical protein
MCRKATGGEAGAFKSVRAADVQWQGEPDWYESSPIARRPFCSRCGTPIGFVYKEASKHMDLTVGSFDDPSALKPTSHYGGENIHNLWLDTSRLPVKQTDSNQPLVDRWIAATGKFPG